MRSFLFRFCGLSGLLLSTVSLPAQWTTQTIQLRPGWNAVFLEVQPEPRECDAALAGLPVETVWRWNRRFTPVQFIQDPNQIIDDPEAWLVWVSTAHPLAGGTSLYLLEGGLPYLIKSTNAAAVNWTITGRPVQRKIDWLADALNLVGFSLPTGAPPTFQNVLAGATGLAGQPLYRMNSSGVWVQVLNPATTSMQRGEAFWVRALGLPAFQGPLEVVTDRRVGLEFGRTLTEQTLRIRNASPNSRTVIVRRLISENPPFPESPALAGGVPLSYWQNDFVGGAVGWTNFSAALQSNLPPGGTWELRLEARRRDMTPYSPPPGGNNGLYQSLLEITDTSGLTRKLVPVSAEGLQFTGEGGTARGLLAAASPSPAHPRAGLWIGSASVTNVSQPASINPSNPIPAASEFSFRLLVHVDAGGQASLLQKVLQMFKTGTYKPAGDGTTNRVVDEPGRFVLITNDRLIPEFAGVAVRDTAQVGRRFSSANFSFREPIALGGTGDFGSSGARWSCPVSLDYRDPLNPFVHRFHPDHDNLDESFDKTRPLPEGYESFTINRQVELEFSGIDLDNLTLAGWGDNQLGGIYRETIIGLHRTPIRVSGTFRLFHASRVSLLNDGR